MDSIIPASLEGDNLGERHRYLNNLVNDAYERWDNIETILKSDYQSPIDRLIMIDLASKHERVEYILESLQDHDMLYVTRALKSTWLLEKRYRYIIYPGYLESALYPNMTTTAVNKMKHWIHLNLRDSERCLEFYKYYSEKDSDYAFKFLCKCPEEIILSEFPKTAILEKITPHRLKVLCEKTPAVAKLFYEILSGSRIPNSFFKKYYRKEHIYFNNIKCILKTDPDTFLDIAEKHFLFEFKRLSTNSTKFIMRHKKDRFMQKPELYTAWILDISALAQCLTPDECEDLVIKLARAHYLSNNKECSNSGNWFKYKNIEPLLKQLHYMKRISLQRRVFINRDVGESVMEWPYDLPQSIEFEMDDNSVFLENIEINNFEYFRFRRPGLRGGGDGLVSRGRVWKTLLDALYDEYRFTNFDKTLFELRKKIKNESCSQNRMYMLLVLVSKSGGKQENLDVLFHLLMEFKNEPCHVRAAVIRSLVKRASVWRVSEHVWKSLLIFGRGLGLDGNVPDADCAEGLHAVVIRTLLSNRHCEHNIKVAFINNFSTFTCYSLNSAEKEHIKNALFRMLVELANAQSKAEIGVLILLRAVDTLQSYKIKFGPEITATIKKHLKNDPAAVKRLLERLFRSKLGRKELYKENFDFVQTDASYINALKHDITILSVDKFLEAVVSDDLNAEQFLRKIIIYFDNTKEDLVSRFQNGIKGAKLHKKLARPITYLMGDDLKSYILELDRKDEEHKRFSALVRANAHVSRSNFCFMQSEWKIAGAKYIANRVMTCREISLDDCIQKLLLWKRTFRLALVLAQRTSYNHRPAIFEEVAKNRPTIVLKTALSYFRRQGAASDLRIWEFVKPLMVRARANPHLVLNIRNADSIPLSIQPEFLTEAFKVINKIDFDKSMSLLCCIKFILPMVDDNFIGQVLKDFVENQFAADEIPDYREFEYIMVVELYLRIFGKYLILCKTEESQSRKLENVGQLYFDRLQSLWESKETKVKNSFFQYLEVISRSLRYTEVFISGEYVSCLPMIEKIVEWMQGVIPVEKHFKTYVPFYLTMLYYKTIRETVEEMPGVLHDKERRHEGYKIVGKKFGEYVIQEARLLRKKYFDSIVVLYHAGIREFFNSFSRESHSMAPYFIECIVDASEGIECMLAVRGGQYDCGPWLYDGQYLRIMRNCLQQKKSIELEFFCN